MPRADASRGDRAAPVPAGAAQRDVGLLMTDVEGSTRLWQDDPRSAHACLQHHHAVVEEAVGAYNGWLPADQGAGDSRFAAFDDPADALAAAVAMQRRFVTDRWPTGDGRPVRVRVAVHAGSVIAWDGNLFGEPVNRLARLCAVGHGGQLLVSGGAVAAVGPDRLPAGCTLRDLGRHRLRDLARAEQVSMVSHPDLPPDFPPLRSLDRAEHNLPVLVSSFVGRDSDLAALTAVVSEHRLVTLTGPGGSGKTRLALQVAAELARGDGDGVMLVDLTPLSDPGLVLSAVARTVGVPVAAVGDPAAALAAHLADRRMLLVLDNVEHVIAAAPDIAGLLHAAPGLSVLATSREPLRLSGEQEFRVLPLAVPAPGAEADPEAMARVESVALFVDRARAVQPGFTLDAGNAAAVAAICRRLDGLPLALELAAARIRVLSPAALRSRLERSLDVLSGGAVDTPERHRTLEATIRWSYDALSLAGQVMLARLSLFVGGAPLAAVEAVAGPDLGDQALDLVSGLVDRSLVWQEEDPDGEPRLRMLGTIRDFAAVRLAQMPDAGLVAARHAAWYRSFAAQVAAATETEHGAAMLDRLRREQDNVRAAIDHFVATVDGAAELDVVTDLSPLWWDLGLPAEGVERSRAALARAPADADARPMALMSLAWLSASLGQYADSEPTLTEGLALARRRHDVASEAFGLQSAAVVARASGDWRRAVDLFEQAIARAEDSRGWPVRWGWAAPDAVAAGSAYTLVGLLRHRDPQRARHWADVGMRYAQASGDEVNIATAAIRRGELAALSGDLATAQRLLDGSVDICRRLDVTQYLGLALDACTTLALVRGDIAAAGASSDEAYRIARRVGIVGDRTTRVCQAADVAIEQGQLDLAERRLSEAAAGTEEFVAPRRARIARLRGDLAAATAALTAGAAAGSADTTGPETVIWLVEAACAALAGGDRSAAAGYLDDLDGRLARLGRALSPAERGRIASIRAALGTTR